MSAKDGVSSTIGATDLRLTGVVGATDEDVRYRLCSSELRPTPTRTIVNPIAVHLAW